MSRIAVLAPLALLLAACGAPKGEAPAPPPITASPPSPSPSQAPAGTSTTPLTDRAAVDERVGSTPPPVASNLPPAPRPTSDPAVPPPATIPDPASIPPGPTPDPLRVMQDSQARRYDYERKLTRLSAELDTARAEVVKRERDLLAFKNPFLPRPQLPPEEAQVLEGLDGAARAKWAEEKLTAAKVALEAAQKSYDDAKANPPLN